MYNKYLPNEWNDLFSDSGGTIPTEFEPVEDPDDLSAIQEKMSGAVREEKTAASVTSGGIAALLDRLFKIDADTILILLVVFFLLSENGGEKAEKEGLLGVLGDNTDLLLIVGLLLILGF